MKGYIKSSEAAKKWGICDRRINALCSQGRIPGAEKFGTTWAIPEDAVRPEDRRIKTGKYIKDEARAKAYEASKLAKEQQQDSNLKKNDFICLYIDKSIVCVG